MNEMANRDWRQIETTTVKAPAISIILVKPIQTNILKKYVDKIQMFTTTDWCTETDLLLPISSKRGGDEGRREGDPAVFAIGGTDASLGSGSSDCITFTILLPAT